MIKSIVTERAFQEAKLQAVRDGFGDALVELGAKHWNIAAVCADLDESIRFEAFAQKYPDRFFQVGVAEQNLIGVAAGLAKEGLTVFAGSYAAFSPGRTFDQIRVSVCYSNRNVKIVGGHAGLTVGPDGATHQMLEDLAMMQALPNMSVFVPSDYQSAYALTLQAAALSTPVYLRLSRVKSRSLTTASDAESGQMIQLTEGKDLVIFSYGMVLDRAVQLAFDLKQRGIAASVINVLSLKPLDQESILSFAQQCGKVMVIEEHQKFGGLGSAVAQVLSLNAPTFLDIVAVDDTFGRSGSPDELLDLYGFSQENLLKRAQSFLSKT